jgi:glycosyltransferase involved in cell wall biosynthesis
MASARRATFVIPGSLQTRTGGYEYDRRVIDGLRAAGWTIDIRELGNGFPCPTADELAEADGLLASIPDGALVVVDGLAFGAMPLEIERHAERLSLVAIVHALLATEVGIDAGTASARDAAERRALRAAERVIPVGDCLVERLAAHGVARDRIDVVPPGTDAAPLARGSGATGQLHLVTVATLNPGKGHDILFRALASLGDRSWRLTCAGSMTRHVPTAARLRSLLTSLRLGDRVTLAGELDARAIADLYDSADLFVLPTLSETYPLSVLEALARGLPVVSTTTGAIPDLVCAATGAAGVLVPPDDVDALAAALSRVLADRALRAHLSEGARRVRAQLPGWNAAARHMAAALEAARAVLE